MRIPLHLAIVGSLLLIFSQSLIAQGVLNFNNRGLYNSVTGGTYNAPIVGATTNMIGQLFIVESSGSLTPLVPTQSFRAPPNSGFLLGALLVVVPGHPHGSEVTVRLRVWEGSNYETALCKGESNDILVRNLIGAPLLGSGPPFTPPSLDGLQSFRVNCIPEPSTLSLLPLSAAAYLLSRKNRRRDSRG